MSAILIVAEHRGGELRAVTLELVTLARALKQQGATRVEIAIVGNVNDQMCSLLGLSGVDELLAIPTMPGTFESEVFAGTVAALIEARKPKLVLIPHSVDGISYAPAVAATGGHGFATDVFDVHIEAGEIIATRAAYKEKVRMELDFPGKPVVVLTVRPGSFEAASGTAQVPVTQVATPEVSARSQHHGFVEAEQSTDVNIGAAEFIVSVGRGIGDQSMVEEIRELAGAMGATLACSRPIVDAGWLPKAHQVGQSGRTATNCRIYMAMGISGAVQHLAGMKHVENIIAVNKDPEAAIFGVARYGVVADVVELAEELKNHFS